MKTTRHTQAVLIFGTILPTLLIGALLTATLVSRGKIKTNYARKISAHQALKQTMAEKNALESFMADGSKRSQLAQWNELLDQEFVPTLTQTLNQILKKVDHNALHQTELSQASGSGSIGSKTESAYSRVSIRFEGGFLPMQETLAELESRMPNMLLEKLSISPNEDGANEAPLSFDLVYHCWQRSL